MTHTAKHKGPKGGTTISQQKKTCGKNVSPPSKLYAKSPSWKNFNFNLYTELLLPKENFFAMGSSQTTAVYIVAKTTPLIILLATVFLLKDFHMRSLVGSMLRTKLTSIRPWKRNCSVFHLNNLKKVWQRNLTTHCFSWNTMSTRTNCILVQSYLLILSTKSHLNTESNVSKHKW